MTDEVRVEVVFALPDRQSLVSVTVARGSSASDAIRASGIEDEYRERLPRPYAIGVWGRPVEPGYVVRDGDRIEIYRPLEADPREARRRLAALGKTMGKPG